MREKGKKREETFRLIKTSSDVERDSLQHESQREIEKERHLFAVSCSNYIHRLRRKRRMTRKTKKIQRQQKKTQTL